MTKWRHGTVAADRDTITRAAVYGTMRRLEKPLHSGGAKANFSCRYRIDLFSHARRSSPRRARAGAIGPPARGGRGSDWRGADMGDLHVVFGAGTIGRALIDELTLRRLPVRFGLPDMIRRSAGGRGTVGRRRPEALPSRSRRRRGRRRLSVHEPARPPMGRALSSLCSAPSVAGAKAAGARYVSFENVYMYGDTRGVPITEHLPNVARTRKGRVRAAMAEELVPARVHGDLEVATARASDYSGPRVTDQSPFGDRVIGNAAAGKTGSGDRQPRPAAQLHICTRRRPDPGDARHR